MAPTATLLRASGASREYELTLHRSRELYCTAGVGGSCARALYGILLAVNPECWSALQSRPMTVNGFSKWAHVDSHLCLAKWSGLAVLAPVKSGAPAADVRVVLSLPPAGKCSTLAELCLGGVCTFALADPG